MWTHHQASHLPLQHHFPWAVYSLSHDVIWPLRWSRESVDIGCRLALASNTLSTRGWQHFLHFGLPCHTKDTRLTQQSDEGHPGDECLSGPWPWAILRVIWGRRTADPLVKSLTHHWHTAGPSTLSRLLGFHEYWSLGGLQIWSYTEGDQIDHVRSHGQNGDSLF